MSLLSSLDLASIVPLVALAALAVFVGLVLLLRVVLHSRAVVPVTIVVGVVLAGPALGGALAAIVNSLVIAIIVCAGATIAALLILRSHPDLREIARDALSLLPRRSAITPPPVAENQQNAITVIDQPAIVRRVTRHNDAGKDWGF
jgi:hypothetical protein